MFGMIEARRRLSGRLLADETGATTVEYALVLVLIVGGLLAGAHVLADASHYVFDHAAHSVQGDLAADQLAALHPDVSEAHLDSHKRVADAALEHAADTMRWRFAMMAVGFFAAAALAFVTIRAHSRPLEAKVEAPPEEEPPKVNHDRIFEKRQQIFRAFNSDMPGLLENGFCVADVMSRSVRSVTPTANISEVEKLMREKHLRHVIVCDTIGRVVGIVSDRDLRKHKHARNVGDVMTADPLCIASSAQAAHVVSLLLKKRISCLPVVDGGKLCGVLTTSDLLMALQCMSQLLTKIAREINDRASSVKHLEEAVAP